ncbi:cytosine methyltransferase [Enterococcus casseliflavus]|nr:cytosine methyltransferase [Enterococcus casseliflavus]
MIQLNKIYNEDCLEGMKKIADQSIDAIICDLPYGTTACSWDTILPFDLLWEQYQRIIKSKGAIVLFGAEPFSTQLRLSNFQNYKYDWYWIKNIATGFTFAKTQPMRSVETISVFSFQTPHYYPQGLERIKGLKPTIRKPSEDRIYSAEGLSGKKYIQEYTGYPNNILRFDKESKWGFHPTQKPVALLEYLVKTYTKENEIILDNCMGSGTTAIACLNTNRQFIGFETNIEYYQKAVERIETNVTQLNLF